MLFRLKVVAVDMIDMLKVRRSRVVLVIRSARVTRPLASPTRDGVRLVANHVVARHFLLPVGVQVGVTVASNRGEDFVRVQLRTVVSRYFVPNFYVYVDVNGFQLICKRAWAGLVICLSLFFAMRATFNDCRRRTINTSASPGDDDDAIFRCKC